MQGDATNLPIKNNQLDSVIMFGGIHHVNDRKLLFSEIFRILKPGGHFYWREPVNDFFLWRGIRSFIYKISPILDDKTEEPLMYHTTVPILEKTGFLLKSWATYGFLGFCFFMNSDVLIFNKLFRFLPGISSLVRAFIWLDKKTLQLPGMSKKGLQVIGSAQKPALPESKQAKSFA